MSQDSEKRDYFGDDQKKSDSGLSFDLPNPSSLKGRNISSFDLTKENEGSKSGHLRTDL